MRNNQLIMCAPVLNTINTNPSTTTVYTHAPGLGSSTVLVLVLSTYLSVLEYLVYGNAKVLVLDQKVLGTYK